MKRHRRSRTGAFGYGLVLAATATASLVGVHHLLAPPGPDDQQGVETAITTNVREIRASAVAWWSRLLASREQAVAAAQPAGVQLSREQPQAATLIVTQLPAPIPPSSIPEPIRVATATVEQELTRSIQHELKRVGCYGGSADGVWNDGTHAAMVAFNDSVSVQVAVKGPERLLLTLLQGHGTRACTLSGSATVIAGAQTAKERQPAKPLRQAAAGATAPMADGRAAERSIGTWRTTVAAAPPGPFIPPPSQAVAAFAAPALLPPLAGRMAVGGPSVEPRIPTPVPAPAMAAAPLAAEPSIQPTPNPAARTARRERQATQRDRAPRPSRPAAARQRDIFSTIARYSP